VTLRRGSIVTVHLINPTEKFWGVLHRLEPVGIVFRGISLDIFEEWVNELSRGDGASLGLTTLFVPLFRVERVFLDEQVGEVESYTQRFERRTGITAMAQLGLDEAVDDGAPS